KKELIECNRPTFFDDNENHSENSSNEIATSNSNQEKEGPPQDSNIRQLIREECCVEVSEEQKQNIEDTILELVEICRQKELLCMHDNVDDLIERALNSKLLLINSQRLKQELKTVMEQLTEHSTRIIESLQNFSVIHKSSISLNKTSQISPVHAIAPILSTKEPEYSPSMRYEHPNTTPETESDEIISECEVTSEDESECDMPTKDDSSPAFTTFSNPLFNDNYDLDSSDDDVENDDNSLNDPLLEEAGLFLSNNLLPSGIENSADDPEGDIHFLEELLIDD
nr:hypothetical protein [Tanacetum cinerariifolium]